MVILEIRVLLNARCSSSKAEIIFSIWPHLSGRAVSGLLLTLPSLRPAVIVLVVRLVSGLTRPAGTETAQSRGETHGGRFHLSVLGDRQIDGQIEIASWCKLALKILPPVAVSDPGVTQEAAAGGHVVSGRGQGSAVDDWGNQGAFSTTSSQERDTSAGILVIWTLHLHTETAAQRYQETAKRGRGNSTGLPLLILQEMMRLSVSPLILTSPEVSRNRQQRTAIARSMEPLIIHSFSNVSSKPHCFALSLNGRDGGCLSVKSGGTGSCVSRGEVPSVLWLTKKPCKESPHPFLTPPHPFLPSIPICRHIVVNK
ncbi:hypothetical protein F7725_009176 [Dissostichus mawsoni]|uniref:Uncharacterized protein n=1 Tax=Dissostichus mawsoni TaxID=36200 RepID=A0A7J5Z9E6_DISMA|nr:hypothetical protein F7725_009176 [Dissostichus mawsoni]